MEETYKDHLIHYSAARVRHRNTWKPIAQITWSENGKKRVKLWMDWRFQLSFEYYRAAEREAKVFAEDWIDNAEKVSAIRSITIEGCNKIAREKKSKKTRGTKKVRKASKSQRRNKISKPGKPKGEENKSRGSRISA